MSTTQTHTTDASGASSTGAKAKRVLIVLLCGLLVVFLGLEAMSLLAAQRTEQQRQEVGMAGGRCRFEDRIPDWLKPVAGVDFHSFMDYPVIVEVTMTGNKVKDENLARLPDLPELQALDLRDSRVTSAGLKVLSKWKNLRSLDLTNTQVTDLTPLAELPQLESLWLNFSQARGEYLAGLSQLTALKVLGAGYIQVSDEDVLEIARCPNLTELSLAAADLGARGLAPLTSLEQLKTLILKDAKVDAGDLQAFQEARPDVNVIQ